MNKKPDILVPVSNRNGHDGVGFKLIKKGEYLGLAIMAMNGADPVEENILCLSAAQFVELSDYIIHKISNPESIEDIDG